MRLIRVMCAGRVDMTFVLRAFSKGADGVFIGACHLGECNYSTHGNFQALIMVNILRKVLKHIGLNPERLRIGFMSGSEGSLYVESVNDFIKKVKELGPVGQAEGIGEKELAFKLQAVTKLVPYIKLVERERLRVPFRSEEEIDDFFSSDEAERLLEETIADKLSLSQIVSLLGERPLSTGEISAALDLSPSEVSKHLSSLSRYRLVRYDQVLKCFALA
jgi:F420-non-reducing hydrogenase iron-sulfur subunit